MKYIERLRRVDDNGDSNISGKSRCSRICG